MKNLHIFNFSLKLYRLKITVSADYPENKVSSPKDPDKKMNLTVI